MTTPKRKGQQTLLPAETLQQMERFRRFQIEKGYGQKTAQAQADHAGVFHRYLAWKRLSPQEVTSPELQEFFRFISFLTEMLHGRRMMHSTFYVWRGSIRHYYRWLQNQGLASENPVTRLQRTPVARDPTRKPRPSKAPHWKPGWVPPQELVDRFLLLPDEYTYTGMRDHAIFLLAATVGVTNSEIAGLTVEGFDAERHLLRVTHAWRTRKGHERWVPLEPHAQKVLERYLAYARPAWMRKSKMTGAVFLTAHGEPITAYAISEIFARYSRRLGDRQMTCKILRNVAVAYQMQQCGRTAEEVAQILGYTSPKLAEAYQRAYAPPEERREADHSRYPAELNELPTETDGEIGRLNQLQENLIEQESKAEIQ